CQQHSNWPQRTC
nr:immunoglobulin light chain junction region [Macaca mulatta]